MTSRESILHHTTLSMRQIIQRKKRDKVRHSSTDIFTCNSQTPKSEKETHCERYRRNSRDTLLHYLILNTHTSILLRYTSILFTLTSIDTSIQPTHFHVAAGLCHWQIGVLCDVWCTSHYCIGNDETSVNALSLTGLFIVIGIFSCCIGWHSLTGCFTPTEENTFLLQIIRKKFCRIV